MALWSQVILEWINCLGLSDNPVKDPKELEGHIYSKIITSVCSWKDKGSNITDKELLLNFIHDEYPDFICETDAVESILDNVLVASLLLLRTSQEPTFHRPMCAKLDHETQIKIKMFLEAALPYGRNITRDYLNLAISELGNAEPAELSVSKTSYLTPKGRPLKDFFNSPAAFSAQSHRFMIERSREWRRLKSELELERCEKNDLIEDLKLQQERTQNLQKKLHDKEKEFKALRAEMMRPATPQSCKKTDKTIADVYREEIKNLEEYTSSLQGENEKLQDEKDDLLKKLASLERQSAALIKSSEHFEKTYESLSSTVDHKDREIVNLRMENEGLRTHIKEMNRLSSCEESFEYDNVSNAHTSSSLNCSEALSSVIDIQLQEAKEETSRLKNEMDILIEKLESVDFECHKLKESNKNLQQNVHDAKSELSASESQIKKLTEEKTVLLNDTQTIQKQLEEDKITIEDLNDKLLDLQDCMKNEVENKIKLESIIALCKCEIEEQIDLISKLEREKLDYEVLMKDCTTLLKDPMIRGLDFMNEDNFDVDQANILEICKHFTTLVNFFESLNETKESIIASLQEETEEKTRVMTKLALEMSYLEDRNIKNEATKSEMTKRINETNEEIIELKNTITKNVQKIQSLQEIANHREILIAEISKLQIVLSDKNEIIDSLSINLRRTTDEKNLLQEQLEAVTQKMSEAEEDLFSKNQMLEDLEANLKESTMNKISVEKELQLLKIEENDTKKELSERIEFINILQKSIEELKINKLSLEKVLNSIKEDLSCSQEELFEKKKAVENLEENLVGIKNDKSLLEKELCSVRDEVSILQEHLSEKNQTIEALETRIVHLEENKIMLEQELKSVKVESSNIQQELTQKVEKVIVLEEDSKKLNNEKSSLEGKLNSVIRELDNKNQELSKNNKTLESLEEQLKYLNNIISSTEKELELAEVESCSIREELMKKDAVINVLENNIEESKNNNIFLEMELDSVRNKLSTTEEELSGNKNSLESLKESLRKLTNDKSSLEKELNSTENKVSTLEKMLVDKNSTIKTFETKIVYLKETNSSTEQELISLKKDFFNIGQKLTQEKRNIEILENDVEFLKNDKLYLEGKLNSVKQDFINSQEALLIENKNVGTLKKEIEGSNNRNSSLESELEMIKQELSNFEKMVSNKNQELQYSKTKIEELEKNNLSLETEMNSVKDELGKTEKKLFDKSEIVIALENDIEELRRSKFSLEQEFNLSKQVILKFETELMENKNEINNLNESVTGLNKNKLSLEENLNLIKHEMSKVQQNLLEKIQTVEDLKTNIEELKKENLSIETELNSVKGESSKIQNDLEDKIKKIEALEIDMEELRMSKFSLEGELGSVKIELSEMQQELSQKNEELKNCQIRVESLEENKNSLENELDSVKQEFSQQLGDHQKVSDELIETITTEYEELQNRLKDLKSDNEMVKQKIIQNEIDLTNAQVTVCELEKQLSQKEETILTLETKVSTLVNDLESLEENLETMKVQEKLKEEKIREVSGEFEALRNEKTKLESDFENLSQEAASLKFKISEISSQFESRNKENQDLISEIDKINQEKEFIILEKAKEDAKMKNLIENLQSRVLNSQNSCEELNVEVKLKEEALQILRSKIESVSKEKIEAELKHNDKVLNFEKLQSKHNSCLEMQTKFLEEKEKEVEDFKKRYKECVNILKQKDNLEEKCNNLEKCREDNEQIISKLQTFLETQKQEASIVQENCKSMEIERSMIVAGCRDLQASLNELKDILTQKNVSIQELDNLFKNNSPSDDNNLKENYVCEILQDSIAKVSITIKAFVALSEKCETLKESLLNKKELEEEVAKLETRNLILMDEKKVLETRQEDHQAYVENLIQKKECLYKTLGKVTKIKDDFDSKLTELEHKWNKTSDEFQDTFSIDQSACDELKTLLNKKAVLQNLISDYRRAHFQTLSFLTNFVMKTYLWIEESIKCNGNENELELENENLSLLSEMETLELKMKNIESTEKDIESFSVLLNKYKTTAEINRVKFSPDNVNKLESQVQNLTKEKKDLKEKIENVRTRNAKLEKNMDELRSEMKKLKISQSETQPLDQESEIHSVKEELKSFQEENKNLKVETEYLREENRCLKAEINSLKTEKPEKGIQIANSEIDRRMKEIYDEYEVKLEKLKQKMKVAYNEQISKLTAKQEKSIQERVETLQAKMEQQCRKHTDEMSKYKQHVSELTSRHWEVCEKLLAEKQEKEGAFKKIKEMRTKFNKELQEMHQRQISTASLHKTASLDRRDFSVNDFGRGIQAFQIIEEETFARRRSVRGLQQAMGNAFDAEDEEGEVFDNIYLADMKEGQDRTLKSDEDRLSVFQMRNSLCKPHLKSSYPAETQFHPLGLTEEDIKSGGTSEDIFNDSLSQSLLPGQKLKKRDRTQTSYKKPGPPTPSKNGGRLSLQGNELRSPNSRILKERNVVADRRTTATPRRLKDFFSNSRQQDENASSTPRRFSSIFRKKRMPTERK